MNTLKEFETLKKEKEKLQSQYDHLCKKQEIAILNFLKSKQSYKDCELSIENRLSPFSFEIVILDQEQRKILDASMTITYSTEKNFLYINRGTIGDYTSANKGQIALDFITTDIWKNEQELKEIFKTNAEKITSILKKIIQDNYSIRLTENKITYEKNLQKIIVTKQFQNIPVQKITKKYIYLENGTKIEKEKLSYFKTV